MVCWQRADRRVNVETGSAPVAYFDIAKVGGVDRFAPSVEATGYRECACGRTMWQSIDPFSRKIASGRYLLLQTRLRDDFYSSAIRDCQVFGPVQLSRSSVI
jgi:hypothetical protein